MYALGEAHAIDSCPTFGGHEQEHDHGGCPNEQVYCNQRPGMNRQLVQRRSRAQHPSESQYHGQDQERGGVAHEPIPILLYTKARMRKLVGFVAGLPSKIAAVHLVVAHSDINTALGKRQISIFAPKFPL